MSGYGFYGLKPGERIKFTKKENGKKVSKGLLISEYPPGTKPARYNFPKRNRLISSWSDKLIIIGPGKGSGSLITGDYAKKYGREIEIM